MAVLNIIEAANLAQLPNNSGQCMPLPGQAEQQIAISATAAQGAAFGSLWSPPLPLDGRTIFIRVNTDTACVILVGSNPTALTTGAGRLAANQTEYFGVQPGSILSVIQTT